MSMSSAVVGHPNTMKNEMKEKTASYIAKRKEVTPTCLAIARFVRPRTLQLIIILYSNTYMHTYLFEKVDRKVIPIKGSLTEL